MGEENYRGSLSSLSEVINFNEPKPGLNSAYCKPTNLLVGIDFLRFLFVLFHEFKRNELDKNVDTLMTLVKLRKGAADGWRRQILCDKRENNSVWKQFPPNFTFLLKDLFVKDQNTVILIEHHNKHAGNRPVTFVTHKRFADVLFVPSFRSSSLYFYLLYAPLGLFSWLFSAVYCVVSSTRKFAEMLPNFKKLR